MNIEETINKIVEKTFTNRKDVVKEIVNYSKDFASKELRAFCNYVMHPDSDLHDDATRWIEKHLGKEKTKVYSFMYNPMIEESGYITISTHLSEHNALKALEKHKEKEYKKWEEHDKWQREKYGEDYEILKSCFRFGKWQDWAVEEIEILD